LRQKNKSNKGFPFVTLIDSIFVFSKKFKKMLDITAHILYDRQVREWEYPAQTRAKLR